MPPKSQPTLREVFAFSRGPLISTVLGAAVMSVTLILLSLEFEDQVLLVAQTVADLFGFVGLCFLVFVGDSIPSPIPPDLILVVIMKSHLQHQWPLWVGLIALTSISGGHFGYWLGRSVGKAKWLPEKIKSWPSSHEEVVRRFGPWAVVLGAVTPLPFSFTCISAGFLKLSYRSFSVATLTRIPRIVLFYLLLSSSSHFKNLWFF